MENTEEMFDGMTLADITAKAQDDLVKSLTAQNSSNLLRQLTAWITFEYTYTDFINACRGTPGGEGAMAQIQGQNGPLDAVFCQDSREIANKKLRVWSHEEVTRVINELRSEVPIS